MGGQLENEGMIGGRIGEETADIRTRSPGVVGDHLALAVGIDFEAGASVAFIRLVQCIVCMTAKILKWQMFYDYSDARCARIKSYEYILNNI